MLHHCCCAIPRLACSIVLACRKSGRLEAKRASVPVVLKAFCERKQTLAFFLLRYLLVQNHINGCPGERQRGRAGVRLIFHISASPPSITQSIDPSVLGRRPHPVHMY